MNPSNIRRERAWTAQSHGRNVTDCKHYEANYNFFFCWKPVPFLEKVWLKIDVRENFLTKRARKCCWH